MNVLLDWLLDLIFPPKCMYCCGLLSEGEELVCRKCRKEALLPTLEGPGRKLSGFERCCVPFHYKEPVRSAILRFKFHGMEDYVREFVPWMVQAVGQGTFDLVTWVPCSRRRRWERGYDQAEVLACALAETMGLEAVRTLEKKKNNRVQSRLKSEAARRANVAGVYKPYGPSRYIGKHILVVDDVITTGATMSQCGQVLLLAGAGRLSCTAIASAKHSKE